MTGDFLWRVEVVSPLPAAITVVLQQSSSRWRFYEEKGRCFFGAALLDELRDVQAVEERAADMLGTINGYCRTVHPNWRNLSIRGISRTEPDRPATQFIGPAPVESTVMVLEPTLAKEGDPTPARTDLAFVLDDEGLQKVLRLYSRRPLDWPDMYRIFEAVRGLDKRFLEGCVPKGQRDRFTHTANHPAATGDRSRHGHQSGGPPSNPMSEAEALAMIGDLVERFRKHRQARS